jgi:hypothetical protein
MYTNCVGTKQKELSQKLKAKKGYRVSLLYIVLQADWIDLLILMVYLTILSRTNITESAYEILPLGHLESYAAGCISSWQVHPSQTGQM